MPNTRIKELYGVTKGVHERIEEGVFRLFDHVKKMKKEMNNKRVYVGKYSGSR